MGSLLKSIFFSCFLFCAVESIADERLPSFLVIGAQKSGTSALAKMLCQHPQIIGCVNEIHFFDRNYHLGVGWYQSQFPQPKELGQLLMDKTPAYLVHPDVARRVYNLLPNAKLIVMLRNPIDRAYSNYWMKVRWGWEKSSFREAIARDKGELGRRWDSYLNRGCYAEQLKRWFAYYPQEQIMVISYEDFRRNPREVLREILCFLNLPSYSEFDISVGKTNDYPPIDPLLRQELSDFFRPFNAQLEALLGRDFNWD